MSQIDRVGTFVGPIVEANFDFTSNGNPQAVLRLQAEKKWVNDPDEMKHFQIATPGYVDWSAYDESIVAFMVLFSDKGQLRNYDQLMAAVGWEGLDFGDIPGFAGKRVLFRTAEDTYNNKTSIKVVWLDKEDAPAERTLGGVTDKAKIAEANAKFLANLKKPAAPTKPAVPTKAAPAKPAEAAKAEAPKPAAPTPAATTASAPAPTGSTPPSTAEPKKTTPPAKKKSSPPPAQTSGTGLPPETSKDEAWEHLVKPETRGANDESVVAEAWVAACAEVGENVDEDRFTPAMWGRVRDIVLKDLGVK